MHLIRNAMDHGLERKRGAGGTWQTGSWHHYPGGQNAGSDVLILVKDDGRGLNKAKILERAQAQGLLTKPRAEMTEQEIYELVFCPGFLRKRMLRSFRDAA